MERVVLLTIAVIAIALGTMFVGTRIAALPEFALGVALLGASFCAALAMPFAFWLLMPTDLARSVPVVAAATTCGMAVVAPIQALTSVFVALASGLAAMTWCRSRFPIACRPSQTPARPSDPPVVGGRSRPDDPVPHPRPTPPTGAK